MSNVQGFSWKTGCGIAAGGLLVAACCLPVFALPFQFVFLLVFGWIGFLWRIVPQIEWDASAALTGVLSLALFTAGLHAFLAWISRAIQRKAGNTPEKAALAKPWPILRTVQIALLTMFLFVAGISMVGMAHQVVWMAQYPGPWLEAGASQAVRRMGSGNNLKQFGIGAYAYHDEALSLPPGMTVDEYGLPRHGWMTLLLPQMDVTPLFEMVHLDKPWNDPANREAFSKNLYFATIDGPGPPVLPAKDPDGYALTHYAGSVDLLGSTRVWKLGEITDGTSQTVLFGEAAGNYKPWGHPRNARDLRQGINQSPGGFGGPWQSKGGQFALADGSVRYLNPKIDPKVLEALATPNAKDQVGEY